MKGKDGQTDLYLLIALINKSKLSSLRLIINEYVSTNMWILLFAYLRLCGYIGSISLKQKVFVEVMFLSDLKLNFTFN